MPAKGVSFRAQQRAYLSERIHTLRSAPEVGDWLDECLQAFGEDDSVVAANVRGWHHAFERARRLPAELVGDFERCTSVALSAWQEARQKNDFQLFAPHLEKVVSFNREMADLWGYEDSPYDALLEEYERGARSKALSELFDGLKGPLVEIASEAIARNTDDPPRDLKGDYPIPAQKAFNWEVCQALGFDSEAGRIDTATHPFCSRVAPYDTRLTTRYDKTDFTSSFFGVLHETGHGLYEQGLRQDQHALPSGTAVSLGIHESQSRLWENQVGRSPAFWEHWLPQAVKHFPHLQDWSAEEITRAVNHAQRTHIRVEADEVTYDLHILLRFDLEKKLVEDTLDVADVPAYWNESFYELTGLKVDSDANGCLQDIHWSMGALGYFPTYSLGNLNAAQLFEHALESQSSLTSELAGGYYQGLLQWLQETIYQHGSRYLPNVLMERATGRETAVAPYLAHLRSRYL